jgi:hypothetical protein
MTRDFNDFFTVSRFKNGNFKVIESRKNEINIYKLLYSLGFRKTNLNKKTVYYLRIQDDIVPLTLENLNEKTIQLLMSIKYENLPFDFDLESMKDWFFKRMPIRQNKMCTDFLYETLSIEEQLKYIEKNQTILKPNFDTQFLLLKFNEWQFVKTIDLANSICFDQPLYYKKINQNQFLLFVHYHYPNRKFENFECWKATYNNENEIGINSPKILEEVSFNFSLYKDFPLIQKYLA